MDYETDILKFVKGAIVEIIEIFLDDFNHAEIVCFKANNSICWWKNGVGVIV